LEGPPGSGKTSVLQGIAGEMGMEFLPVIMSVMEPIDPMGMPRFFETMGRESGSLSANRAPEFLLTHPLSSDRTAEARGRARQYPKVDVPNSSGYELTRARIRLFTNSRPELALEQFRQLQKNPGKAATLEVRYGLAIANSAVGNHDLAERQLNALLADYEDLIPLHSALGIAQMGQGDEAAALKTFEHAMSLFPRNVPLTVHYCEALLRAGQAKKAHTILLDLLNQVPPKLDQVRLIAIAANRAGDTADSHYYMAEYHAMNGNLHMAIDQLKNALETPNLDSVQKARYKARLDQFTSYLPTKGR
jgi:predicted Zn-dependent protease